MPRWQADGARRLRLGDRPFEPFRRPGGEAIPVRKREACLEAALPPTMSVVGLAQGAMRAGFDTIVVVATDRKVLDRHHADGRAAARGQELSRRILKHYNDVSVTRDGNYSMRTVGPALARKPR